MAMSIKKKHLIFFNMRGLGPALKIQSFFAMYLVSMQRHLVITIFFNKPISSGRNIFQEASNLLLAFILSY